MQPLIDFFANFTNPNLIMQHGGLYIVVLIVFIETGLFFGFFLPGDSLLFIAGMVIANALMPFAEPALNLLFWMALITVSGIAGNFAGYWFGKKSQSLLFERKDTLLFKKRYLLQAKLFYEKRGGGAIVLARFFPLVRTFAPIVAGMVKMNAAKFALFNALGSFLWVGSIVTAGYLLGDNPWVRANLEKVILTVAIIPILPVLVKLVLAKRVRPAPVIHARQTKP